MFTKAHAKGHLKPGESLLDIGEVDERAVMREGQPCFVKVTIPNDGGVRLIGRKWMVKDREGHVNTEFLPNDDFKKAMGSDLVGFFVALRYHNGLLKIQSRTKNQSW